MSDTESPSAKRAFSNPVLVIVRLVLIVVLILYVWGRHQVRYCLRDEAGRLRLGHESAGFFYRGCLRILGIRVGVRGDIPDEAVLFIPNHVSYMDMLAVGAVCPTFFVSKVAVARWPIIGHLFRLSKSLTIDRRNVRAVKEVNGKIAERFEQGHSVCVFLEGTTSSGLEVLPFHASLVQCVLNSGGGAVPVAIDWHTTRGRVDIQEDVAYWKDHEIVPHGFRLLGLSGIAVTLTFGEVLRPSAGQDRKEYTEALRTQVVQLLGFE